MDSARQGTDLLEQKEFTQAIECFNKAISVHPGAPDYYIKRSTAYSRLSPPQLDKALADAEAAVGFAKQRAKRESIAQAQLRRGIVYFALEKYGKASQCFDWVEKLSPKDKSLAIWKMRTDGKLQALEDGNENKAVDLDEYPSVDLGDVKEQAKQYATEAKKAPEDATTANTTSAAPAVTPVEKIRHDWYQTTDAISLDVMAKGVPKDKVEVDIQPRSLELSFPVATGSDYNLSLDPLFGEIDPSISSYKVLGTKIQFTLKKATPGQKWKSLEGDGPLPQAETSTDSSAPAVKEAILASRPAASGPAYPTSSKSGPKNWDKVATDLTKKPEKTEGSKDEAEYDSDDGSDPVNGFFKKLYGNADPDTRRAMMKSYSESNGTALSTNWSEVSKGKVETSPPEGMEAKAWEK